MTLAVARIGDKFLDTDTVATGSGDVFVNNIPVARLSDKTLGHTLPGHGFYPPVPIIDGSGSVFCNNLPVASIGSKHAVHCDPPHPSPDCHDGAITVGSTDVITG